MIRITRYWKAIGAFVGPGLGALAIAWFVTTPHVITGDEWALIIAAVLPSTGLTAVLPANRSAKEVTAAVARRRRVKAGGANDQE